MSGAYRGPVRRNDEEETGPLALPYEAFNTLAGPDEARQSPEPASRRRETGPTELGVIVDQLTGAAAAVRSIWLPPLPTATALTRSPVHWTSGRTGCDWRERLQKDAGRLSACPSVCSDDPARQWQGQWFLDLTVAGGHAAVIGGPQSGKTTLLRTLVLSLALTHTPREIGVYGLDLVGGGLQALSGLPHVGGIAGRADRERAARTVEEVRTMLALREDLFREHGIDSVDQLRTLHAADRLPNWRRPRSSSSSTDSVRSVTTSDELDDAIADILKRGGGYGIHVVAGMLRWNDVRIAIQSNFGTRVELRLNDPGESGIDRKLAETLIAGGARSRPHGRKTLRPSGTPRTDGVDDTTDLGAVLERTARTVRATWNGEVAQPVRVLPQVLEPHSLPGPAAEPTRVPIGLDQSALAPVLLDLFHHDQHLLVLGDSECGKTNLLRTVAHGLVDRYGEDDLVFAVMDPRRSLRGVVPEEFNGGYAYNSKLCAGLSAAITTELEKRLPDENARLEDLEPGNWGKGPRIVVLVDDYDVSRPPGSPSVAVPPVHPLGGRHRPSLRSDAPGRR